jgi:hypothetical protein
VGSTDLYDLAVEYLDACTVALADTPDGVPECVYVSPGPPVWDVCPALMVHVGGPVIGDTLPLQPMLAPLHRVQITGEVILVSLTATVLRCAPVLDNDGKIDLSEMGPATRQINADLWAIWNHVRAGKRNGTLFAPREREFAFEPAVSVNQQGGACGWQITIRSQLDGYPVPGEGP